MSSKRRERQLPFKRKPRSELEKLHLAEFIDELSSELEKVDFVKLIEELGKYRIIEETTEQDLNDVDPRVDKTLKLKYLLQQIHSKLLKDKFLYNSFLRVLEKFSINAECQMVEVGLDDELAEKLLTEQDIPELMNVLAGVAHRWDDIGVALNISIPKLDDIGEERSSKIKLYKVLNAWIIDGTVMKPATLSKLKAILAGPIVELPAIAQKLSIQDPTPIKMSEDTTHHIHSRILCQSRDTMVSYGMSILLEVQVISDEPACCQWSKGGKRLYDNSSYQGTSYSILLVRHRNMASRHIEGRYVCEVEGIGRSREILVTIKYPESIHHLLDKYCSIREVPEDSWPPVKIESFVKLALINKRESDNLNKFDYSVRGDMDDILCAKDNISYEKCFGKYKSKSLLVVEGRPGVGKTTLAHKVIRDWSAGENVLVGADLVFLVSLRLLNVNKTSSIFELLGFNSDKSDKYSIRDFESCKGLKCCFILDGLDEYWSYNNEENIIYNLITKWFKAMVIVFSRPVGNKKLTKCGAIVDRRIEILGFKSSQISHYVNSYFQQDSRKAEKLMKYLGEHINVLHMCYLPVHVAMVCYIHSQYEDSDILKTETQIYEQFAMLTIIRKLRRECNNEVSYQPTCFQNLNDKDKNFFKRICTLAFDMCVDQRQVFENSNNEILLSDESDSDGPSLGLVTVDSTAKLYNYNDIYAFLHLTFQEYLAAYHIFSQTCNEQVSIIEEHKDNAAMLVVWKFYCGLMGQKNLIVNEQVQTIFSSKLADTLYRVHCAFEYRQPTVCNAAIENEKQHNSLSFRNKIFTLRDYNAISYVMSEASGPISKLAFYSCRLQHKGVTRLIETTRNNRIQQVNTFVFHSPDSTSDQFQCVRSLLTKMTSLEILDMYKTTLSQDTIIELALVTLPHLKHLRIMIQIPFKSHKQYLQFLKHITFSSQPETVNYHTIGVTDDVDWYHSVLEGVFSNSVIVHHDKLHRNKVADLSNLTLEVNLNLNVFARCTHFYFVNCFINDHKIKTLFESFDNYNSIEKLVLDFNEIGQEAAAIVSKCTKLKHFSIRYNSIHDEGAKSLAGAVRKCTDLVYLNLEYNCFGDEGAIAIASAVSHLNIQLYLWNANITKKGVCSVLVYVNSANIRSPRICNFERVLTEDPVCFGRAIKCCTCIKGIKIFNSGHKWRECAEHLELLRDMEEQHVEHNYLTMSETQYLLELSDSVMTFSSLQELVVSCNYMDSKDVAALTVCLKSWTNLQTLNISGNIFVSKSLFGSNLQTQDISRNSSESAAAQTDGLKSCTNLKTLCISYNYINLEGIAALADCLKPCPNLQSLDICYNSFNSGVIVVLADNLKSCRNLHTLNTRGKSITTKGAAALANGLKSCTNLQTLNISYKIINSEDMATLADGLKFCTNLQTLDISSSSINLEGISALADGLKSCINLQTLDIRENGICSEGAAALADSIKSCINLQTLNIGGNSICSEGAAALADGIKSCTNLQTLDIRGNSIHSEGAAALADGIKYCINFQTLDIRGNSIGSKGAVALGISIKTCTNLQILDISCNGIGPDGAAALAYGLKCCTNLQTLDISYNRVGSGGAAALAYGLKHCTNLQTLNIKYNGIGSAGAAALVGGIKSCTYLQILDISGNSICSRGVVTLANGLKSCTNLQMLNIYFNSIGSEGAIALATNLKSCTNLLTLDIGLNGIGSEGTTALTDCLESCTNLRTLNIYSNYFGSKGAKALANGLQFCTNLRMLDISLNSICTEGAVALVDGLKYCTNLETLNISGNRIGSEGAVALADGLKYCIYLQTLNVNENSIGSEGAAPLADGLKSCTNLQTLHINHNSIGSESAAAFAYCLKSCSNFQALYIRGNSISSEGAVALVDGLKSCIYLKTLDIGSNNIGSKGVAALFDGLKSCIYLKTLNV